MNVDIRFILNILMIFNICLLEAMEHNEINLLHIVKFSFWIFYFTLLLFHNAGRCLLNINTNLKHNLRIEKKDNGSTFF